MTLQILEIVEKFMDAAAVHVVVTDYVKLDCITTIFTGFLSRSQPLPFWKYFLPVFNNLFRSHGATLMSRENDRFLKQVVFHLLRLAVFRNESIRKRAVVGLQILVRVSFNILSFCLHLTQAFTYKNALLLLWRSVRAQSASLSVAGCNAEPTIWTQW